MEHIGWSSQNYGIADTQTIKTTEKTSPTEKFEINAGNSFLILPYRTFTMEWAPGGVQRWCVGYSSYSAT